MGCLYQGETWYTACSLYPPLKIFENKRTFWKWKHILKMKAHSKNEIIFWKWKHILKIKASFENERTFWKWKHILQLYKLKESYSWSDHWSDNLSLILLVIQVTLMILLEGFLVRLTKNPSRRIINVTWMTKRTRPK